MEKSLNIMGVETQYSSRGLVYKTSEEGVLAVPAEILDSLVGEINTLRQQLNNSLNRGDLINLNTDKVSRAYGVTNHNNNDTGEVLVPLNEFRNLISSTGTTGVSSNMILGMQKQMEKMREVQEYSNRKNSSLKKQIVELQQEKLKADNEIKELNEMVGSFSTVGVSNAFAEARTKSIETRRKSHDANAAKIIDLTVQGYSVYEIQGILADEFDVDINIVTIYRAISVKEDGDRDRVLTLYEDYISQLGDSSKEDILDWFETTRIKKLKLVSKDTFIRMFGAEALPEPDKYIVDEFYSTGNINQKSMS